jgi:hypothetical protein
MSLPKSRRVGPDCDIKVTAGAAYEPGDVVEVVAGLMGVVQGTQNIASGDAMVLAIEDRWEFPAATGVTASLGDAAYWDASGETVVAVPTATTKYLGRFSKAKTSGQLVCEVLLNAPLPGSGTTLSVAAAGSTQSDAAALQAGLNTVSAADGTKGVLLPAATAGGATVMVYNEHATNGLKIYPATGDDINDGSANAAITIEGKTIAVCRPLDATTWAVQFTTNT